MEWEGSTPWLLVQLQSVLRPRAVPLPERGVVRYAFLSLTWSCVFHFASLVFHFASLVFHFASFAFILPLLLPRQFGLVVHAAIYVDPLPVVECTLDHAVS